MTTGFVNIDATDLFEPDELESWRPEDFDSALPALAILQSRHQGAGWHGSGYHEEMNLWQT